MKKPAGSWKPPSTYVVFDNCLPFTRMYLAVKCPLDQGAVHLKAVCLALFGELVAPTLGTQTTNYKPH